MTSHLGEDGASNRVILKVRLTWWYGRKRLDQMMILKGDSSSIFTKVGIFYHLFTNYFSHKLSERVFVYLFVFKNWVLDWPIKTRHRSSILSFERENPIKFFVYFTNLSFSEFLEKWWHLRKTKIFPRKGSVYPIFRCVEFFQCRKSLKKVSKQPASIFSCQIMFWRGDVSADILQQNSRKDLPNRGF